MTGLGKLAGGADVASLGLSGPAGGDVEMVDVGAEEAVTPAVSAQGKGQGQAQGQGQGQGGKGKKKSGKGKR